MEQRDSVSSSTSLNQYLLSRRILSRKPPPTKYPPVGVNPFDRIGKGPAPAPAPGPSPLAPY